MAFEDSAAPPSIGDVYRDILVWARTLPLWQQELLRRTLSARDISPRDVSDLAAGAVAEAEQQPSTFLPLSIDDLPSVTSSGDNCTLVALSEPHNVNALRPDQLLSFGDRLTVVYGDNAAGKSGYARILKQVYRARVVEEILTDVRADTKSPDRPHATFVVRTPQGSERRIAWQDGSRALDAGRFSVIDAACSVTYVRGGVLAVGPAGIDVPRRFAEGVDAVKRHLASSATAALPDKRLLQRLENESEAGQFVRGLSSSTTDTQIANITGWDSVLAANLEKAETLLAQARAQAPSARRAQLQSKLRALESLGKRLVQWTTPLSPTQIGIAHTAQAAVQDSRKALRATQLLGDVSVPADSLHADIWTEMLKAAAAFVASIDTNRAVASTLSVEGRCPLCWQTLDDAASGRVARFQEHLRGAALKQQQDAAQEWARLLDRIRGIPDAVTTEDRAVLGGDENVLTGIDSLMSTVRSRRDLVLDSALRETPIVPVDELDLSPLVALRELYVRLQGEISSLPATDEDARAHIERLEKDVLELTTRRAISQSVEDVRTFVARTREHQRLRATERAINTRAASNTASELHAKHMTDRYAAFVDEELRELRFRRRHPILAQKTNKANVEVAPLVSMELKHIPAERVFSEGERTAIALASFLAELRLGNDGSGLIFDDPVNSLDHGIREHVARRIVAAAKQRQVIVFTRDLAFLADLREQAEIQHVGCVFRTLTATDYAAGFVENDEPFGARSVKKRIGVLKQILVSADRAAKDGDLQMIRSKGKEFYESLRSTWERFVEERLFARVVQRLERHVIVGALRKVTYSPELGEMVHEGWRRCSNALEAHDHAPATGGQTYSIEEMRADLNAMIEADGRVPST